MHLTLPSKQHATNETATKDVYEPWNRIQPMREPEATQTQTLTSRLQNQISFLCYSLTLHQFIATLSFGNSMVQSWTKPSLINCQSRSPKPSIPQGSKAPANQSWHSKPWLNKIHIPNTPQKNMLGDTENESNPTLNKIHTQLSTTELPPFIQQCPAMTPGAMAIHHAKDHPRRWRR